MSLCAGVEGGCVFEEVWVRKGVSISVSCVSEWRRTTTSVIILFISKCEENGGVSVCASRGSDQKGAGQ